MGTINKTTGAGGLYSLDRVRCVARSDVRKVHVGGDWKHDCGFNWIMPTSCCDKLPEAFCSSRRSFRHGIESRMHVPGCTAEPDIPGH